MVCSFKKYTLHFKRSAGTSRGVLKDKDTYILMINDESGTAYGECNRFTGLSYDDLPGYEEKLADICRRLPSEKQHLLAELSDWPSIYFGVETALKDVENGCKQIIFPEGFSNSGFTIPANGLIWMGTKEEMERQVKQKLQEGYTSIKFKIGAIDFNTELALLKYVRNQFNEQEVEIRVDANGAFSSKEAKEKIRRISEFGVHYIEQPIKAGQWQEMAALAEDTPVKIALDEELIGINDPGRRRKLVETISPQMLILKPALVGGFSACDAWKELIESRGGSWVITSALESNIGLNAIAQYAAQHTTTIAQGLGTGQLFTNNFPSPYSTDSKGLHYHCDKNWDFSLLS